MAPDTDCWSCGSRRLGVARYALISKRGACDECLGLRERAWVREGIEDLSGDRVKIAQRRALRSVQLELVARMALRKFHHAAPG